MSVSNNKLMVPSPKSTSNNEGDAAASSAVTSLPPPCPKSPPEYPDLYGKRRELAKVQMLEREIGFLQDELRSAQGIQPASKCCKEVSDFVLANSDPLIPTTNRKNRRSCRFWRWLCGIPCFSLSWICCCRRSKCCSCPELPRCCDCDCDCNLSKCCSCFRCSAPKLSCCSGCCSCSCSCTCPKSNCCKCRKPSCSNNCCSCGLPSCPDCSCCKVSCPDCNCCKLSWPNCKCCKLSCNCCRLSCPDCSCLKWLCCCPWKCPKVRLCWKCTKPSCNCNCNPCCLFF